MIHLLKNAFAQTELNEIVDSSKNALKNGDGLAYLKGEFLICD